MCFCGKSILLDDDAPNWLFNETWRCNQGKGDVVYFGDGHTKGERVMSRFIISVASHLLVDHKDHNTHNNQKDNLRPATRSQNGGNRLKNRNNKTGFKGVTEHFRNGIVAKIRVHGKLLHLGTFNDYVTAAKAYNDAAVEHFGEFAKLNVIP